MVKFAQLSSSEKEQNCILIHTARFLLSKNVRCQIRNGKKIASHSLENSVKLLHLNY